MNPYETLGVPKNASEKDIKKAFRKLARESHPDTGDGGGDADLRQRSIRYHLDMIER